MTPLFILGLITAGVAIIAWWRIYLRIGWPPFMAVVMAIPFINMVAILYVAFTKWPIEDRLTALQDDLKGRHGEL